MPAQSYLANVPGSGAVCTIEASLSTYRDLDCKFTSRNVSGDPWVHVDTSGKTDFHISFSSTLKAIRQPERSAARSICSSSSSSDGKHAKRLPGRSKKKVLYGSATTTEAVKTPEGPNASCSKNQMYKVCICFLVCFFVFMSNCICIYCIYLF